MPVGAEPMIGKTSAVTAQALVRHHGAPIFDAVRPLDHKRQRHAERGGALRVAQQRGEIDGLAGAIDAALGVDEGVEPGRRGAARDAAVGEIEGRRLEAEEGVVALRIGGDQQRGRQRRPPRARAPASNCACPFASVRRVASTSLLREISRSSIAALGIASSPAN